MKKFFKGMAILASIATIGFASLGAGCTTSDNARIQKQGYFVCGITYYAPMNYFEEDTLVGFDTELAVAVGEKIGLEAKFQLINWESKYTELSSGAIDVIWNGFTISDESSSMVDFSYAYLNNQQCVVMRTEDAVDTKEALNTLRGVAESGSAGEDFAKDMTTKYTAVDAQTKALTELTGNTADFAVIDSLMAKEYCGKGDFSSLTMVEAINLGSEQYGIGFKKGSDFKDVINQALKELLEDGTILKIATKYNLQYSIVTEFAE